MKRKAYLLLELLIALSILALCALPLVRTPLFSARQEIAAFEKMELARLAELGFAKIFEQLHQNEIPPKAFEAKTLQNTPYLKDTVVIDLPGILNKKFNREFFLWTHAQKEGPEQNEFKIVRIKITFTPFETTKKKSKSFTYSVFIELNNNTKKEGKVL
ncbi:MAG: hypothetical protein V4494_01215 [Chlamydiota bacterium]